MRPKWFKLDEIPYDKMWTDDRFWLKNVLNDQQFYGYFKFKDMVEILDYKLQEVQSIDEIKIPKEPISL